MDGGFDFSKGQIYTNSPSKPRRGVVGCNIDRRISTESGVKNAAKAKDG